MTSPLLKLMNPSSAERWQSCPGSLYLSKDAKFTSSAASVTGTIMHTLASDFMVSYFDTGIKYDELAENLSAREGEIFNKSGFNVTLKRDHINAVLEYVDYIIELKSSIGAKKNPRVLIEYCVNISLDMMDEVSKKGYIDCVVVCDKALHIIDFKGGRGVAVSADDNAQLLIYAYNLIDNLDAWDFITSITMHIVQPLKKYAGSSTITKAKLKKWYVDNIIQTVIKVEDTPPEKLPLNPSDKACCFCPAKLTCPALKEKVRGAAQKAFDPLSPDDSLSDQLDLLPLLALYAKAVNEEAFSRLSRGEAITEYCLVRGIGQREWLNEDVALKFMADHSIEPYEQTMLSLPKAEKMLSKPDRVFLDIVMQRLPGKLKVEKESPLNKHSRVKDVNEIFNKQNEEEI